MERQTHNTLRAGIRGQASFAIPIDMRQASRGETMTNNRSDDACSGGAPGTGIGEPGDPSPSLSASHPPAVAFTDSRGDNRGSGIQVTGDVANTLHCAKGISEQQAVAFQTRIARNGRGQPEEVCPTLQGAGAGATSDMRPCIATAMAVRRLTPTEAERLQGFPDGYTAITRKGKPAADGPRYRALGNSMAVPVMRWIGERIEQVERLLK